MRGEDLTGRVFGRLTVVARAPDKSPHGKVQWICRCNGSSECVAEKLVTSSALTSGRTTSCGCARKENELKHAALKAIDLAGHQFGLLTCKTLTKADNGMRAWVCTCRCGCETIAKTGSLRGGHTLSCGCLGRLARYHAMDLLKQADWTVRMIDLGHGDLFFGELRPWPTLETPLAQAARR